MIGFAHAEFVETGQTDAEADKQRYKNKCIPVGLHSLP